MASIWVIIFLHTYMVLFVLCYLFCYNLHSRPRKNKPGTIPVKFVAFLRASLAKMAGHHYISPDFIDMEFWAKMPLKLSAVKLYDKSLVNKTLLYTGLIHFKTKMLKK